MTNTQQIPTVTQEVIDARQKAGATIDGFFENVAPNNIYTQDVMNLLQYSIVNGTKCEEMFESTVEEAHNAAIEAGCSAEQASKFIDIMQVELISGAYSSKANGIGFNCDTASYIHISYDGDVQAYERTWSSLSSQPK